MQILQLLMWSEVQFHPSKFCTKCSKSTFNVYLIPVGTGDRGPSLHPMLHNFQLDWQQLHLARYCPQMPPVLLKLEMSEHQ
jgi:hypothetical protein